MDLVIGSILKSDDVFVRSPEVDVQAAPLRERVHVLSRRPADAERRIGELKLVPAWVLSQPVEAVLYASLSCHARCSFLGGVGME